MTLLANASPEILTAVMFIISLIIILMGNPIAFALFGAASITGLLTLGPNVFNLFQTSTYAQITGYSLLAVPLFVFMGNMIETTGIAKSMFEALNVCMGHIRGGLLVVAIIIGTILAACVGIVAASISMLTIFALPIMLEKGYSKPLCSGTICASGTLGVLIPPSILLVVYGPTAGISVGKLFMAAFGPGFLLSLLYIGYVIIACKLNPNLAPASEKRTDISTKVKLKMLLKSLVPPLFLILAVLGSIGFGIAAPTEAAAVGALAAVVLAICYRTFTFSALKKALIDTVKNYAMVIMIVACAKCFTSLFLKLGCGNVIADLIMGIPGGRWASFLVIMFITFILGMFIDWIGIIFIMVPIITPLVSALGFDPLWFAMMVIVNLQMSFITPPFATSLFFYKGTVRPEWNISTIDIYKGIIPFVGLVSLALVLCTIFPQIITWLPSVMIK